MECSKSVTWTAPDPSFSLRKYAPDRPVDLLRLSLDITPDFSRRRIEGRATFVFKPMTKPVRELRLDAVELTVTSVSGSPEVQSYENTGKEIVVTFVKALLPDNEARLEIQYNTEPSSGLYFRTPEMGYQVGDSHLWTQGEPIEARHWHPCFDFPNEKFASDVTCRVPVDMTVLSNGKLVSNRIENGRRAVRWVQEKPHSGYLISLVAGYFKSVEDKYKNIPLAFYTPPSNLPEAGASFRDTREMMGFFEEELGVPYPWDKYFQVVVHDFTAGGMENTSLTTLTESTLFRAETENIRNSQGLVAHELAHQWFGDLVTCKDWSHVWLNEGFATYYALRYDGFKNGRDSMLYGFYVDARNILAQTNDSRPVVFRGYDSPNEQFSYLAYGKGSWVLHMLRSQLGDELFRRCIQTYLQRHQLGNVVTEDLNRVIEELSGRSFDRFFDQWIYHAHYPELEIRYNWDAVSSTARVSVRQAQTVTENVLLFEFPLAFRFKGKFGTQERVVTVKQREEDFYFLLESSPETFRVDPKLELLAQAKIELPPGMLYALLEDRDDVIGQVLAIEQLGKKGGQESVRRLTAAVEKKNFYAVKNEAVKALQTIHTDEAFESLRSLQPEDARVRNQVAAALAGFYRDEARGVLEQIVAREKNPEILSHAIRALGRFSTGEVRATLQRFLDTPSYRNALASAAIGAMRLQDDSAWIGPLQEALEKSEKEFTSSAFGRALDSLAYLARHEVDKEKVRGFLLRHVNHKKQSVQLAAMAALGTLDDSKAIPVLETWTGAGAETPQRKAAQRAISTIRDARKSVDSVNTLRDEMFKLQANDRELRKDLDLLKRKLDAAFTNQTSTATKPAFPAKKTRR